MTKNIFGKEELVVQTIDKVSIDEEVHQEIEEQHYPDAEYHEIEADAEEGRRQKKYHENEADAEEGRRQKKHKKKSHKKKKRSHKKHSDTESGAEDLEENS